jgi:hypothetical protein
MQKTDKVFVALTQSMPNDLFEKINCFLSLEIG